MSFFLHFRLCLFCFVYTVIFFFFQVNGGFALGWSVWKVLSLWFLSILSVILYANSECDFICLGFCFIVWKSVVLKISITLSLKNQKTDRNQLKPKYTETDWFQAILVGFSWEFHKPKYSVLVGHSHTNRPKPNQAHP